MKIVILILCVLFFLVYIIPYINIQGIMTIVTENTTFATDFFVLILTAIKGVIETVQRFRLLLTVIACYCLIFLFNHIINFFFKR